MAASASLASGRLPGLDGLRALAVALVVAFHLQTKAWLPGGFVGVDLFFVLSGFLITTLLLEERRASGRIDLGAFYVRRLRRLMPAFVATLALVVVVTLGGLAPGTTPLSPGAPDLDALSRSVLAALVYGFNWVVALGLPHVEAMVHVWSLSIEEQFYLLWPLALIGLRAKAEWRRTTRRALAAAILLSLSIPFWHWDWDWRRLYYASDYRAHAMLAGCLLAVLRSDPETRRRMADSPLLRPAAALSALYLGAVALSADLDSSWLYLGGLAGVALASAVVILWAVESRPEERARRLLDSPPLVWLGRRSYGVYLYHLPLLIWSDPLELSVGAQAVFVCGATLLLAELSWRGLERPILAGGARRPGLSPPRASLRSAAA